ncbi:MAG: GLUG motif-containing protein [Candidatus Syntrophosphaera sp.]
MSISMMLFAFAGGTGSESDPWEVQTAEHLDALRNYLGSAHSDKYYIQTADINLNMPPWNSGEGWIAIGTSSTNSFRGHYNGDGYSVNGPFSERYYTDWQGLFGYTYSGSITNLHLSNVNITGWSADYIGGLVGRAANTTISNCSVTGSVTGRDYVGGLLGMYSNGNMTDCTSNVNISSSRNYGGGLVGSTGNYSTLTNCSSSGTVTGGAIKGGLAGMVGVNTALSNCHSTGSVEGSEQLGGLVGYNGDGYIHNCSSTGNVFGTYSLVGGLVGFNYNSSGVLGRGLITCSYSTGNVTGTAQSAGGLVGSNSGWSNIEDCFSRGNVQGSEKVGGLVGRNLLSAQISTSFSTGTVGGTGLLGGLVGSNESDATVTASYWDIDTSAMSISAGGSGKNTASMTWPYAADTFVGWDFIDVWIEDTSYALNDGYPFLFGFGGPPLLPPVIVSITITGGIVEIIWEEIPGATGYRIEGSDEPYTGFVLLDTVGAVTEWTSLGPLPESQFYRVIAFM